MKLEKVIEKHLKEGLYKERLADKHFFPGSAGANKQVCKYLKQAAFKYAKIAKYDESLAKEKVKNLCYHGFDLAEQTNGIKQVVDLLEATYVIADSVGDKTFKWEFIPKVADVINSRAMNKSVRDRAYDVAFKFSKGSLKAKGKMAELLDKKVYI